MNKDYRIVKEKRILGEIHSYYKGDKLIKKIDYTRSPPWLYTYHDNNIVSLKTIKPLPNKKFWFIIIGTALLLACICAKCKISKHKDIKAKNITTQNVIE